MDVRLVEQIKGRRDYVTLATGHIDGDDAAKFVRSLVAPGIIAYCSEGHKTWRWKFQRAKERTFVNKIVTYGSEALTLTDLRRK